MTRTHTLDRPDRFIQAVMSHWKEADERTAAEDDDAVVGGIEGGGGELWETDIPCTHTHSVEENRAAEQEQHHQQQTSQRAARQLLKPLTGGKELFPWLCSRKAIFSRALSGLLLRSPITLSLSLPSGLWVNIFPGQDTRWVLLEQKDRERERKGEKESM